MGAISQVYACGKPRRLEYLESDAAGLADSSAMLYSPTIVVVHVYVKLF